MTRGDILEDLPGLVDEASRHGPVVVFHSAVVAYLEDPDRRRFARMMADLVSSGRCHWVSNEGKRVLPEVTTTGPDGAGRPGRLRARRRRACRRVDARPWPVDDLALTH